MATFQVFHGQLRSSRRKCIGRKLCRWAGLHIGQWWWTTLSQCVSATLHSQVWKQFADFPNLYSKLTQIELNWIWHVNVIEYILRDYLAGLATQYDEIIDVRTPLEFEEVSRNKKIEINTWSRLKHYLYHNINETWFPCWYDGNATLIFCGRITLLAPSTFLFSPTNSEFRWPLHCLADEILFC